VLQSEGRTFGLIVDHVLDTEEIVVKALSQRLKSISVYSGATILGDGRVALILDVQALGSRSLRVETNLAAGLVEPAAEDHVIDVDRLLVAEVGDERRVAIPLTMVTRLEQFAVSSIERVGSREVVRYRGQILPLVRLGDLLGTTGTDVATSLPVVVYTRAGRSVALAVEAIVDIVEQRVDHQQVDDVGLLGSAVIQERVTELLDVRRAILAADPAFYTATAMDPEVLTETRVGAEQ